MSLYVTSESSSKPVVSAARQQPPGISGQLHAKFVQGERLSGENRAPAPARSAVHEKFPAVQQCRVDVATVNRLVHRPKSKLVRFPKRHARLKANWRGLNVFFVAELTKSFGFPCTNGGAESPGDFRYALSPRHLVEIRRR